MEFIIKRATKKSITQIVSLLHKTLTNDFPEYTEDIKKSNRCIFGEKYYKDLFKRKKNVVYCAFIKNQVIGSITIINDWGGAIFINWLVIDKEFRNKGVASKLLKTAEKWALKHFNHYIYLYTESDKNIEFYKKRGFEYVGLCRNSWFGANEHLMQKILKDIPFKEMYAKYNKS